MNKKGIIGLIAAGAVAAGLGIFGLIKGNKAEDDHDVFVDEDPEIEVEVEDDED